MQIKFKMSVLINLKTKIDNLKFNIVTSFLRRNLVNGLSESGLKKCKRALRKKEIYLLMMVFLNYRLYHSACDNTPNDS